MTDATNGGANAGPGPQGQGPQLNVLGQYIKDFSFENPNAPNSLQEQAQQQPQINIQINVEAKSITQTDFEVELRLDGKAETPKHVMFAFELVYAGVFRLQNIPQDNLGPLLLIECPRLLFPFARELIASATSNSGFPPLLLAPVDFVTLYHQKVQAMAAQQSQATVS